ncbi:MAG: isoleucine--tRNA ligase, partial [Ruminococcus sp.]|nr:isoleucine--tRNA ligase [Ruminococcus sp.]
LCVNPDETYCRVKAADGYIYTMAQALLDTVLSPLAKDGEAAYEILESCTGKDLEYTEYEPLFECSGKEAAKQNKKAHFVTCDSYVTMSDGTGIVHIAPAFGEDDSRIGRNYDLPFVQFVDGKGIMTEETPFAGLFVKDADPEVLKDLDKSGKLFSAPKFEHDYPHCWRCNSPLIYYARDTWFIRMTDVKDRLIANNNTINWIPESIGTGRFGDWLKNVQDWGISRNRYWGTPLNIWECECGCRHSIGSIEELKSMSDNCPEDIELHRPFIDAVTIKCPECGKQMKRVPEVIDCWFDSGSMPFAQHHYPFENKELFESQFPADFISEAVDQTRGWFYSLLAISTLIFDKAPFKNVIVLGLVQDENGQKMSKSKGNAVDPFEALEKFGADAIRWYFYTNSQPWLPNKFHDKGVTEGQRKFMGTLWNTYAFYILYAEIDKFDPTKYEIEYDKLSVMDKWLLSKMNTMIKLTDDNLANYRIPEAAKAMQEFVDDLSNWYVRRGRERYWVQGMNQDKINAYMTLWTALVTLSKCAAPMVPFITEEIYQNLVRSVDASAPESIHLCDYPVCDEGMIDPKLESDMDEVLKIVILGRSARNGAALKNRQPLSTMYVSADHELDSFYVDIIRDELNLKAVEFRDDVSSFIEYKFKPQLKTLGPRYGKNLNEIRTALTELDGNAAYAELMANDEIKLNISIGEISLDKDDLLIESAQKEGFYTLTEGGVTVAICTVLTPELIEEGYVREVVSKIQTMRKDSGFEVMDHIVVTISGSKAVCDVVEKNRDSISTDVLANSIAFTDAPDAKDWDINGEKVKIGVKRV